MKTAIIITVSLVIGGLSYAVMSLQSANSRLEDQLQTAMSYQQQLQDQTELTTRQRLEFESQIAELQDDLLEASTQVSSLNTALSEAQQRANPEYEDLLEQARREIAANQPTRRGGPGGGFAMFSDPATTRRMAEDNTAGRYVEFLESLGISSSEMDSLYEAVVDFSDERYQMLGQLMTGNLTADQATAMFGANAMSNNLGDLLTPEQAADFETYDLAMNRESTRQIYSSMLNQGGGLTGQTQDLVMDVLMDELYSEQNNFGALVADDGSMTTAYEDKMDAFARARSRLEPELDSAGLTRLDQFVERQRGTVDLILEATTDSAGNVQVRNMKAAVENLPN